MKIMGKYAIAVMVLVSLIGLGGCKVDPTELLVADNLATIDYSGAYTSLYSGAPATLTVIDDVNSNIVRIILTNGIITSGDLLGPFDCIGAGRTNTINGVPRFDGDLYVYFSDDNTYSAVFTGCLFSVNDYELTITIDVDPANVLVASNISQPAGVNPNVRQIVKDGIVYTLTATSK